MKIVYIAMRGITKPTFAVWFLGETAYDNPVVEFRIQAKSMKLLAKKIVKTNKGFRKLGFETAITSEMKRFIGAKNIEQAEKEA